MQIRRTFLMALIALALALALPAPTNVQAQTNGSPTNGVSVPITGTGPGATFTGVLNITRFAVQGNQIVAIGTLVGALTNTVTGVTTNVTRQIQIPVNTTQSTATCTILNLVLGPLDLDLLGLQIHLDQVVLVIEAQPGPGNLLGNLLCAVANLLNQGGSLSQLVTLLNNILAALG